MGLEEAEDLAEEIRRYFVDVEVQDLLDNLLWVVQIKTSNGKWRHFSSYGKWIEYMEHEREEFGDKLDMNP